MGGLKYQLLKSAKVRGSLVGGDLIGNVLEFQPHRLTKQNGPQVFTCGPPGGLFGIDQEVVTQGEASSANSGF